MARSSTSPDIGGLDGKQWFILLQYARLRVVPRCRRQKPSSVPTTNSMISQVENGSSSRSLGSSTGQNDEQTRKSSTPLHSRSLSQRNSSFSSQKEETRLSIPSSGQGAAWSPV